MKLGIIAYDFDKAQFERAKDMGLSFLEFCINCDTGNLYQKFYDSADDINKSVNETGITVGSVGRWGTDRINEDGSINEEELKADITLIKAAAKVNCPVFVCGCNYRDGFSLYENCTFAIRYFENLLAAGREVGVKIATYNCRWGNFVHSDPVWSIIHGYLKDLYIKYDTSHSIYANGENYLAEINKWGGRFAHVHIKGSLIINGERVDDPPAGLDMTNWGAVLGLLYTHHYEGGLSIEPHSQTWHGELGERGIEVTIKKIKELMV